jgi:hypothetical protein
LAAGVWVVHLVLAGLLEALGKDIGVGMEMALVQLKEQVTTTMGGH